MNTSGPRTRAGGSGGSSSRRRFRPFIAPGGGPARPTGRGGRPGGWSGHARGAGGRGRPAGAPFPACPRHPGAPARSARAQRGSHSRLRQHDRPDSRRRRAPVPPAAPGLRQPPPSVTFDLATPLGKGLRVPEFVQGHSQWWLDYFAALGHRDVRPLAAGVEGAIYDLGDATIAKVWGAREVAELALLQRCYADVAAADLPFATPEIISVQQVKDNAVSYEAKLPGQSLQLRLADDDRRPD